MFPDPVLHNECMKCHTYLSMHLPIICLYVYLPIHISVCLSVYLSVCLSVYLSICLHVGISVHPSICRCVCRSVSATECHLFVSTPRLTNIRTWEWLVHSTIGHTRQQLVIAPSRASQYVWLPPILINGHYSSALRKRNISITPAPASHVEQYQRTEMPVK
jgi:hypothetical protein